jgi:dTDP-4-amino-4,6-dideoxygalactose transaminase
MGENLSQFEKTFAEYCQTKYCVGVNSGTDALILSLMASGIKAGDKVATVSYTFPATIMAIQSLKAIPVLVDVDENGYMDYNDLILKTKGIKAIIPVHFTGGICPDMFKIVALAKQLNIPVIEDACQAVGAIYNKQKAGGIGTFGCFSFFPTKNLSCLGDGGAVTTNDKGLYDKLILLRNFGRVEREEFVSFGINTRLDEIQAIVLNEKMKEIDKWLSRRRFFAKRYTDNLPKDFVALTIDSKNYKSSYHLYIIKSYHNNKKLIDIMKENDIDCRIHYSVPCHRQPFMNNGVTFLRNTEELSNSIISLPMRESLTIKQQDKILSVLEKI